MASSTVVASPAVVAAESQAHEIAGSTMGRVIDKCHAYGVRSRTGSNSNHVSAIARAWSCCAASARVCNSVTALAESRQRQRHCSNTNSSQRSRCEMRQKRGQMLLVRGSQDREKDDDAQALTSTTCTVKEEEWNLQSAVSNKFEDDKDMTSSSRAWSGGLGHMVASAAAGVLIVSAPADAASQWLSGPDTAVTISSSSQRFALSEQGQVLQVAEQQVPSYFAASSESHRFRLPPRMEFDVAFPEMALTEVTETVAAVDSNAMPISQETDILKLMKQAMEGSGTESLGTSSSGSVSGTEEDAQGGSFIKEEDNSFSLSAMVKDSATKATSEEDRMPTMPASDADSFIPEATSVEVVDAAEPVSGSTTAEPAASVLSSSTANDLTDDAGTRFFEDQTEQLAPAGPAAGLEGVEVDASPVQEAFPTGASAVSGEVEDVLTSTFDSINATVESAISDVEDASQSVTKSARNAVESINSSLQDAIEGALRFYRLLIESAQSGVDSSIDSIGNGITNAQQGLTGGVEELTRDFLQTLQRTEEAGLIATRQTLSQLYEQSKAVLPPEVREAVEIVAEKVAAGTGPGKAVASKVAEAIVGAGQAAGLDLEDPAVGLAAWLGLGVFLGVSYWQSLYGGYDGDLTPEAALQLLRQQRNVALVDVRSQEERARDGIPDLRRSARYKMAVVEFSKFEGSERSMFRNADETDNLITAAKIANLKIVNPGTQVIVLDGNGRIAKEIARAVIKRGTQRAYQVEGGFDAWQKCGLRIKDEGAATPLQVLKEEAEAFIEESDVKPTPVGLAAVTVGFIAAGYALYEWEKTLQLIGLLGTIQLVYSRTTSYQDVEDLKKDVRAILKPIFFVQRGLMRVLPREEESNEPTLAASPTEVEAEVVSAAAKLESSAATGALNVDNEDDEDANYDEADDAEEEEEEGQMVSAAAVATSGSSENGGDGASSSSSRS